MAEVSSSWDVTFPVLIELLASLAMPYRVLVVLALVAPSAQQVTPPHARAARPASCQLRKGLHLLTGAAF